MTVNSLGIHDEQDGTSRTAAEWLWALMPIGVAVFCLSALVYYHLHHDEVAVASALQVAVAGIYRSLGFAPAFLFFLLLLTWSSIWFVVGRIDRPMARLARLAAMTVMLGVFMNLGEGGVTPAFHKGELGAWLASRLVAAFGYYPSLVLVWAVTFGSLLLATDYFFSEYFERLRGQREPVEGGVEPAVTDHLKGLAMASAAVSEAVPDSGADLGVESAGSQAELGSVAVPAVDDAEVVVEPLVDEVAGPAVYRPRRRSYFERRNADSEDLPVAGARPEDVWVPIGPDAQEIENPEIIAAAAEAVVAEGPVEVSDSAVSDSAVDDGLPLAVAAPDAQPEPVAADVEWLDSLQGDGQPSLVQPEAVVIEFAGSEAPFEGGAALESEASPAEPAVVELAAAEAGSAPEPDSEVETPGASESEQAADLAESLVQANEPVVSIPRPDPAPSPEPARQQNLFGPAMDEALVAEAVEVVTVWRRASATFLQRKLRIDYPLACRLLAELAARGIVELEADAAHGRVLG